jgi:hypothetical protein
VTISKQDNNASTATATATNGDIGTTAVVKDSIEGDAEQAAHALKVGKPINNDNRAVDVLVSSINRAAGGENRAVDCYDKMSIEASDSINLNANANLSVYLCDDIL